MNKKILFITNTIQTMSGAAKIMRFVASYIACRFTDVEALILYDNKILNDIEGVKIRTLGCKTEPRLIWRASAIHRMRREIKSIKPDIICTFVSDACLMTRIATLGMPVKIISCDRGDPSWREGSLVNDYLWDRATKWTYKNSDACVFQLPEVRDYFGESNLKKTFIIPNPFIPTSKCPDRIITRKKTIVSAGRFTNQKGFDVLINAFSLVHERHPEYHLIIYGDGDLKEMLLEQVKKLNLERFVHLPGFVENVSEAIKEDGIFVLSSRYEGIPNAMIEALSMGLPCVATDCSPGGAKFLSKGGQRALIVPVDDTERLADKICEVIENDVLAKSLSKNAIEVRNDYMPETIAFQWYEVIKTFASSESRG